jgi:hypothetical protein
MSTEYRIISGGIPHDRSNNLVGGSDPPSSCPSCETNPVIVQPAGAEKHRFVPEHHQLHWGIQFLRHIG